ncbi:twitching motility protein PilT [Burkholderia sp. SG-MS1]|uniref:Mut7-C RNAse domain-containing protein n=1 Tax=Paraburkholderia sp. SG-MS1 TaxID=2023741 RepID=UPI001446AAA2|nr:Mut7-C RNAse domain-containing protein [Paraburkholderia sp. SG-MS1]NKJ48732.1 twitching motility protein PilT [Paraburkholderia sp. SG-MS1]
MVTATFRFYEELNDFLARPMRRRAFSYACAPGASAKHMIEALGVPHTEVELILVNGESVGFDHPLVDGDRVAVYPKFEALDIRPLLRVRERPLRVLRFIADAHLGGLAPLLRLAGFDTLYDNHYPDADIEALCVAQQRIVLTRDRELLKRRSITHGCYVRTLKPREQLREVFERLDLAGSAQPFRLCLMCNAPLRRIAKEEVGARAPDGVLERHNQFVTCDVCRRVFWEGTHWQRMRALIDSVAGAPERPD